MVGKSTQCWIQKALCYTNNKWVFQDRWHRCSASRSSWLSGMFLPYTNGHLSSPILANVMFVQRPPYCPGRYLIACLASS